MGSMANPIYLFARRMPFSMSLSVKMWPPMQYAVLAKNLYLERKQRQWFLRF